jgi:hypothetical protein
MRAQLAAQLQYAPQKQALALLLQQAQQDYQSGVQASQSAATGVARSARRAIRPTRQAYAQVGQTARQDRSVLAQQLGGLGAAADPYKASAATEFALADQLRGQERAGATTELRQRAVEARQGAAYDARALRGQLQDSVLKIGGQLSSLAGQQGASQSKTYLDLLDQANRDRISQGNLTERQRHDRATEHQAAVDAQGGHGPGGVKLLATSQQNKIFDQIDQAMNYVKQLSLPNRKTGKVLPTGAIRNILLNGLKTPVEAVYDPDTGKPVIDKKTGLRKTTGGAEFPAFKSKLIVNAAFDLAKFGYLSEANVKALHRAGLLIHKRYKVATQLPAGQIGPPSPQY